jgi:hypothetical protein
MSIYLRIDMTNGIDFDIIPFDDDTLLYSCILFWGKYNNHHPLNERGFLANSQQFEFRNFTVKEIKEVIIASLP